MATEKNCAIDISVNKADRHSPHKSVFVDQENKIIYLHTHKNASKTIRRSMLRPRHTSENIENLINDGYKTFWVVRNPLERVVSSFSEIGHMARNMCKEDYVWESLEWKDIDIDNEFEFFIERIEKSYFDPHVYPQILTLIHKNIKIEDVDRIILFDNLQEEILSFVDENGIQGWNLKLYQVKTGPADSIIKKHLSDRIQKSTALQERIISLYEEDMEIYQQLAKLRGP